MNFLPIVARELRLTARRPTTYRLRSWAALVVAVITVAMAARSGGSATQIGARIFALVSGAALALALFSGVRCTADCLSEEKRAGTLGLLFLTDLRGYDIVLGKLVVTSLDAAYTLVAILPVLAVPLLLGSVTGSEFWRMALLLLNTLGLSLMCGLLISAFGRQERSVMLGTLLAVLALSFGLPLLWKIATALSSAPWWDLLLLPSPAYAFHMVSDSAIRLASREYYRSMLTIVSLTATAFLVSSLSLPRIFQERGRWEAVATGPQFTRSWRFGSPHKRQQLAEKLLPHQPFLWLLSRDRFPKYVSWGLASAVAVFLLWMPSLLRPGGRLAGLVIYASFGAHVFFKLLLAADAARRLNEDKRSGPLELLLTTPLAVPAILQSQVQSTYALFKLPALALLALNANIILWGQDAMRELGPFLLGGLVILFLDRPALTWTAMLLGLRQNRYFRAVLGTIGIVLGLPWVVCFFFLFCTTPSNETVRMFFFLWFLGAGLFDLGLAMWARNKLLLRFRALAANDDVPVPAAPSVKWPAPLALPRRT